MAKRNASYFDEHSDPLPARIATGLSKVGLALRFERQRSAGGRGISPTQGQILALLAERPGLRTADLATALALKAPTVSDSVRVLSEKGLVRKAPHPDDARASTLDLTDAGRVEASDAASWPDFLVSAIDALTPPEQEVFLTGLLKMVRTLQEREQIPVSRMCVSCTHFRPFVHDGERPHHCALVDAPFGSRHLRLECAEHEPASPEQEAAAYASFQRGAPER